MRPATQTATVHVEPLSERLGARVHGVALTRLKDTTLMHHATTLELPAERHRTLWRTTVTGTPTS